MRVDQLNRLFNNEELRNVLSAGQEDQSESLFAPALLQSSLREKLIPVYFQAIQEMDEKLKAKAQHGKLLGTDKDDSDTLIRLVDKFEAPFRKVEKDLSSDVNDKCKKLFELFEERYIARRKRRGEEAGDVAFVEIEGVRVKKETVLPKDYAFETIPEGACKLSALKEITAEQLAKLHADLTAKASRFQNSFVKGQSLKLQKISATEVGFSDKQNYLLVACPATIGLVEDFMEVVLSKNIQLLVSVHEAGQYSKPVFWSKEVLEKLKLQSGWTFTLKEENTKVLVQSSSQADAPVQIVQRQFLAKKGDEERTILHLHYQGWQDLEKAPDEEVLFALLNLIDELEVNGLPFSINCNAGHGRTGVIAVSHFLRRYIDGELLKGKKLDEISLNIPEIIYEFRKYRSYMVTAVAQFAQIYAICYKYYEHLKNKEKA